MKKKIVSLTLAIAMCFSLLTVTAPSAGAVYEYAPELSVAQGYVNSLFSFLSAAFSAVNGDAITSEDVNSIGSKLKFSQVGKVSYSQLENIVEYYNASLYGHISALIGGGKWRSRGAIRYQAENDIYRIYDHSVGEWVVDANGEFPYALGSSVSGDVPAGDGSGSAGACRWLSASGTEITNNFRVYSKAVIDAKALELTNWGHPCQAERVKIGPKGKEVECWAIRDDYWYYYCDEDGNRLVALVEETVTDDPRPSVDNDGNLIEGDNGIILDNSEGILNLIGQLGDQFQLDFSGSLWDFGTNSYTVNAYTTVNEGDEYYYTYYTYNVQYNITNTYITYIGSNDAYEREEYELYYQLPDGRSSADLTADEVAGMSFEFYDVVNYERSTDDISVQALYHFDGNTDDSSYFSGLTDGFVWTQNASITYMEAPSPFDGCLYLDERAHAFYIDLPEHLVKEDFTVTFRYYQASEPDTLSNKENGLYVGDEPLLIWDEANAYNAAGTVLGTSFAVGTWQEITFQRYGNRFNVFINGVRVSNLARSRYLPGDRIYFRLGDTSRAYSMIDEFRVVDYALYPDQTSYIPTAVPYDSNLTLVLPDAERPMADKYYHIESSGTNLLGDTFNFIENGGSDSVFSVQKYDDTDGWSFAPGQVTCHQTHFNDPFIGDRYVILGQPEGVTELTGFHYALAGYMYPILTADGFKSDTDYTLSLVHVDGTIDKFTFNTGTIMLNSLVYPGAEHKRFDAAEFDWGEIAYGAANVGYNNTTTSGTKRYKLRSVISIWPNPGSEVDIAYIEVVEGTSSDIKLVETTDVYDGADIQPNTAAIQTTIPVKGYTVGGVRPSMPKKGDLWFPVSENRITSVQIYTGSMWQEVGARWFTGSRWIPIYAFDITTLEDLFDIADGDSVVPLLPDQNSFLRWWQLQWLDFRAWLENALSNSGSGGGTSLPDDEALPGEDATDEEDGWSFVDLLVKTKDGIWKITKGIVRTAAGGITGLVVLINDAGNFFDPYQDGYSEGVFDFMNYGGDDIWD